MRPASADGTAVAGTDGAGETAPAGATFADPLAGLHRRFDAARFDDIYVVGDVHGCIDELRDLLDPLDVDSDDLVVFVGDLVRKGPDSEGVVDLVRSRDNALTVRGNNEQKLLDGEKSLPDLTADDLAWMESLPLAITLPGTVVTHGGVNHRKPLAEHGPRELMEMRGLPFDGPDERPYWFETRTEGPQVAFGHTVLDRAFATDWAVGLDTGCVHGRALSWYDWRADEVGSMPVETTYEERAPSNVLSPRAPQQLAADD
jgi:serine/threonine protein phosphatase 1